MGKNKKKEVEFIQLRLSKTECQHIRMAIISGLNTAREAYERYSELEESGVASTLQQTAYLKAEARYNTFQRIIQSIDDFR
jgi:hypothetical protein